MRGKTLGWLRPSPTNPPAASCATTLQAKDGAYMRRRMMTVYKKESDFRLCREPAKVYQE